jgi:uncharacterized YigZ family protein
MNEEYYVPGGDGVFAFVEKRSRFIGYLFHVTTEEEALSRIGEIKAKHHDAKHNVYAYLIRETGAMRYSDDGEPQGTAGMPVLEVLRRARLTDVCCVVTRYFGGILLGTGGLTRAYAKAAKDAVAEVGIHVMRPFQSLSLSCPYALFERVKQALAGAEGILQDAQYGAEIQLSLLLPLANWRSFAERLVDLSGGGMQPAPGDVVYCGVPLEQAAETEE